MSTPDTTRNYTRDDTYNGKGAKKKKKKKKN